MKRTVGGIYREDCVANFCIINPNVNRNIMVENDKFIMDTPVSIRALGGGWVMGYLPFFAMLI